MEMGKTNKTPEFLKLNPFGKVGIVQLIRACTKLRREEMALTLLLAFWTGPNIGDPSRWCLGKQCYCTLHRTSGGQGTLRQDSY